MNTFKELISGPGCVLGTWVKLPTVESVELMAIAGFDFAVIDLEHSPMSIETAATLITVANGRGMVPLVRVPDHSPSWIQRCLDAGAAGILAPHVDTAEQAAQVAAAARFEPVGTRGVGPTSRAGNWGLTPMSDYLATAQSVSVIAQIESRSGAESVDAILADKAVDALFVGAADLSISLGLQPNDPQVTQVMDNVLDQCRAAGIACGTAIGADPDRAATLGVQGYSFVMVSNDATILGSSAAQMVSTFRTATPTRPRIIPDKEHNA